MTTLTTARQSGLRSIVQSVAGRESLWRKNPSLFWGTALILLVVLVAIFAEQIVPYDPIAQDWENTLQPPSRQHIFGTDNFGRDVLSRVIMGTPLDLSVGVLAVLFPLLLGVIVGTLAGYYGSIVDTLFMRLADAVIAFPFMVLIIVVIAVMGPGLRNVVIAVTAVSWVIYARIVRSEILVAKELEYVMAAKALGYGDMRIMLRHILPNVISPVIIFGAIDVVLDILLASSLGFLGLGAQPPQPEWGALIAEGRGFITTAWWMSTFPGVAVVITGTGFTLLADGLADVLRPGES